MNQISEVIKAFCNEYVATGSNIAEHAHKHGITNTECFQLVKMGQRLNSGK